MWCRLGVGSGGFRSFLQCVRQGPGSLQRSNERAECKDCPKPFWVLFSSVSMETSLLWKSTYHKAEIQTQILTSRPHPYSPRLTQTNPQPGSVGGHHDVRSHFGSNCSIRTHVHCLESIIRHGREQQFTI